MRRTRSGASGVRSSVSLSQFQSSIIRTATHQYARLLHLPARHHRCVRCEISSGCAVEPGLGDGEENGQGPAFMDRREGCLRQAVVRPRRAGDGWPDGNRVDAQRLAIMVSSVDRSSLLSRTVGAVMPSHSGAASPEWGKLSQRSSPWATARTPSAHAGRAQGLAVHLAELNC